MVEKAAGYFAGTYTVQAFCANHRPRSVCALQRVMSGLDQPLFQLYLGYENIVLRMRYYEISIPFEADMP